MKYYIVLNKAGLPEIISPMGFIPANVVCEAPDGLDLSQDDGRCIVLTTDKAGKVTATINTVIQAQIRGEVAASKAQRIAEKPLMYFKGDCDRILNETMWTQLNDASLQISAAKILEWANYRQAIRNLKANTIDPTKAVFPTRPT